MLDLLSPKIKHMSASLGTAGPQNLSHDYAGTLCKGHACIKVLLIAIAGGRVGGCVDCFQSLQLLLEHTDVHHLAIKFAAQVGSASAAPAYPDRGFPKLVFHLIHEVELGKGR